MEMKRIQGIFNWVLVLSEASHIFCCVLPTLFSITAVLVGLGFASAMPIWMTDLHEVMHQWEVPMISMSGIILVIGWILYLVSEKIDCHDTGCKHGPCATKKSNASWVLKIATILFLANISVYLVFHRGLEKLGFIKAAHEISMQDKHEHHN